MTFDTGGAAHLRHFPAARRADCAMLGPNDIDDWDYCAADRARAELRADPRVRAIARHGVATGSGVPAPVWKLARDLLVGRISDEDLDELRRALPRSDDPAAP